MSEQRPPMPRITGIALRWVAAHRMGLTIAALASAFCIGGIAAILYLPDAILRNWFPTLDDQQRASYLWPAAQAVLFTLGGAIAIIGVSLSIARHREELLARARAEATLKLDRSKEKTRRREASQARRVAHENILRERFVTATELLSDDTAPIRRTAGIYALAAVADAWAELKRDDECQTCIDVLCAYLRAPLGGESLSTPAAEVATKRAGYDLIRSRLLAEPESTAPSWEGRFFNLTSARIDFPVNLTRIEAKNGTRLLFEQATVSGRGTLLFDHSFISHDGYISLSGIRLSERARVSAVHLTLSRNGRLLFSGAQLSSSSSITLDHLQLQDNASASLSDIQVENGGRLFAGEIRIRSEASVAAVRISVSGSNSRVAFRDIQLADSAQFVSKSARIALQGRLIIREIRLSHSSQIDASGARLRTGARMEIVNFELANSSAIKVDEQKLEGGMMIVAGGALRDESQVHAGFRVHDIKAKPVLNKVELWDESVLTVSDAKSDTDGVLWMSASRIDQDGAISLGRVSLLGGRLVTK